MAASLLRLTLGQGHLMCKSYSPQFTSPALPLTPPQLQGREGYAGTELACAEAGQPALRAALPARLLTPAELPRPAGGGPGLGAAAGDRRAWRPRGPQPRPAVAAGTLASAETTLRKIVKEENEAGHSLFIKINKWPQIKGFKLCAYLKS